MKIRAPLLTFLLFSAAIPPSAGEGAPASAGDSERAAQVPTLREIDSLIRGREYNAALAALAAYMRAYPADFDRAQKRVRKIMRERLEYDKQAEALAQAMKDDEKTDIRNYSDASEAAYSDADRESDQRKLEIITSLENHEQDQTETAEELTRQARKTLALRFYIVKYNSIMEEGYRLLDGGRYGDAVAKFGEGFGLKPSDSDKIYTAEAPDGVPVTYDEDITAPVDEHLARIESMSKGFAKVQDDCEGAYRAFVRAVSENRRDEAMAALGRVKSSFGVLAALRNGIRAEADSLREIDRVANERNPDLKGFSYITFTLGFVEGDENVLATGVLGTMDYYWNTRVESMKEAVYERIRDDMRKIPDALSAETIRDKEDLIEAQIVNTNSAIEYSSVGTEIQRLNLEIRDGGGRGLCEDFTEYIASMDFMDKFASSMQITLDSSRTLANRNLRKSVEDIEDGEFIASRRFIEEHLAAAVRYEEIMNRSHMERYIADELGKERAYFRAKEVLSDTKSHTAQEISEALDQKRPSLELPGATLTDEPLDFRDILEYQQRIAKMNEDESKSSAHGIWGGLATLLATNAEDEAEEYEILDERAGAMKDGVEVRTAGDDGEEETVVRKYPREAKSIYDRISAEVRRKLEEYMGYRESLSTGEKYRGEIEAYDSGTKRLDGAISRLEALLSSSARMSGEAAAQVRMAERARDEAEQNYRRALEATDREDFQRARDYLSRASAKYAESFDTQESLSDRSACDAKVSALSERIIREENELVIREVRDLINEAQDSYYDGNLEYAEKRLVMAQSRWAETNSEKNEEIESLLELVSTARTLQIGRKIRPTDPLYSDMSQLLSVASQHYEDGERLMGDGRRDEAEAALSMAREKLEPMRVIYPLNDDAAFLRLKIERLLDPEAFAAGFKRRVDEANTKKSAEKLAMLESLLKINPTYPGLSKQVEELQYELGIKTRPQAKASPSGRSAADAEAENRRRAESLYAQAQRIFSTGTNDQAQLRQASALLDEIIRMYSRQRREQVFRNATALKDRIQGRIGGSVVAVLTADDEAKFQRAQNYVNRGNYDAANDILEALWKKPAAQRSKKIVDLRTFVKNRL